MSGGRICSLSMLVLHEIMLALVLMYGSKTMLWKEKERSRIRAVQMTISEACLVLGGWIVANAQIRELCGVMKGVDERIDEGILHWFSHVERMENDKIAKSIYRRMSCTCLVGRPCHGRDELIL